MRSGHMIRLPSWKPNQKKDLISSRLTTSKKSSSDTSFRLEEIDLLFGFLGAGGQLRIVGILNFADFGV
ncbi:unnamed protein product [Linum trigynum]|uniref:Uncharacterized protein n=1 Tax=Linum trigynum TaxID=586398 RepID=A0AAV2G718_9ROSI